MARLSLSQIQRLQKNKELRVEDVITPLPDYTSTYERIKLFICGVFMLTITIICATLTLFSIFSKIIDFNITHNTIQSIFGVHGFSDEIQFVIDFLKEDWHYCLLLPILLPWSVILGWLGWIGFKLYRHN
eukprot:186767_1